LSTFSPELARRRRFEALYEENYHRILGYARRRVKGDDAADVVAETFLTAWRRLEDVPDGHAGLLWLYGAAWRVLANHERARRRRERLAERTGAAVSADAHYGSPSWGENLAAVAFAALQADDRELLALVAWEGLDASEIAHV
jgi:DNA-directed RNA polymerase specialized sigma24 family protein